MSFQLGRSPSSCIILLFLLVSLLSYSSAAAATAVHPLQRHDHHANGSIGNELAGADEWALESEIGRQLLQSSSSPHIGYQAFDADKPVGRSRPGNPYTRNCQGIYHCRG